MPATGTRSSVPSLAAPLPRSSTGRLATSSKRLWRTRASRVRYTDADRAVVEPAMLRDYLLSPTHPVGRFKAAFFLALRYSTDDWRQLEADLRRPFDRRA